MNPRNIVVLRCFLHHIICLLLAIGSMILLYFAFKAPEPCDVSALTLIESVFPTFFTIVICTFTFEIVCLGWAMDTPNDPSMHTSWTVCTTVLLGKIVFVFPAQLFNGSNDVNRENRKKAQRAVIESETNDFDHGIDQREPPTCSPVSYRHWTSLETILAIIVLEFVVFLLVYTIVRIRSMMKSMIDQRIQARRESKLIEARTKHESIWLHRIICDRNVRRYFDHVELVAFLTRYAADRARTPSPDQSFSVTSAAVIDLNTKSAEIDRLIYSMVIFECKECRSDNGIYLTITSDFLRQSRLIKISSMMPLFDGNGRARVWAFVQHGLAMCVFKCGVQERTRFVLYNIRDEWNREFDVHSLEEFRSGCFWCLIDDGREMSRQIWRKSMYIRIVYYCTPNDQSNVGFAMRQSLWEIRRNGTVTISRLQEITYGSNWTFTDHYQLIRTSRGQVGIIGELIDWNVTTGEDGDGARWTTCVVYSPETRKLSAIGDYENYLEIDPALRQYFDRNYNEYESTRYKNFTSMRRIEGKFLCPQVLTDVRAIDILDDGTIRSIDFEPRSLKWLSLKKVFDAHGKRNFDKYLALGLKRMMGVDLGKRF